MAESKLPSFLADKRQAFGEWEKLEQKRLKIESQIQELLSFIGNEFGKGTYRYNGKLYTLRQYGTSEKLFLVEVKAKIIE